MKKIKLTIVAAGLMLATGTLYSCKKDSEQQAQSPKTKHQYVPKGLMKTVDLLNFEPNTMTWAQLTVGQDASNVQYRKAQLYLSRGLAELVKDSTIAHWITSQTQSAEDNVISFEQVFSQFPGTKQILESVPDPLGEFDNLTFEQIQTLMDYDGLNIKSSIFLANPALADASYKPISVGGFDLDMGDNDTHPSDVVLGWHLDATNNISKVSIWEEVATASVSPILSVDGRTSNSPVHIAIGDNSGTESGTLPLAKTTDVRWADYRVSIIRYKANFRYDVSKTSELFVAGKCAWKKGGVPTRNFLKHDCVVPAGRTSYIKEKKLRDIHKNDIGKWWDNQDSYFCRHTDLAKSDPAFSEFDGTLSSPFENNKLLIFNTYEHDWFASEKPLSPATLSFSSAPGVIIGVGLKGKMSRYDEWYLYPPSWSAYTTLVGSPILQLPRPTLGWTFGQYGGKGDLVIKTLYWCPW